MDILFSPPNIGALPSSAMAEVEIKTEALRTSSLQQMLDLERKYKMDRLQLHSAPTSPPASPPPPADSPTSGRPPLQIRRADSLSRQQNFLMLKAVRRSTAPPPLSITIPDPPASGRDRDLYRRGQSSDPNQEEEDDEDTETETTAEPLHKQVKFLAPDDEDRDDMSDQSSICQSPSWEGYGQRKKEKKKEAERKKKEKEQADKEAKAAKKRLASRLSKSPPASSQVTRNSSLVGITNAERTMSDPLLTSLHSSVESRLTHVAQIDPRASSTNDLQHTRQQRRPEAENTDSGTNSKGFLGGVKLEREKGALIQGSQGSVYPPSLPYQLIQTSGPEPRKVESLSPTLPAIRQESRSPREIAFPPSASRTPMLRNTSGSTHGHSRSNSLLQGATKFLRGQDGKSHGDSEEASPQAVQDGERGRDREQGRQQRPQSASRAVVDEQSQHSSSTRSSSRNPHSSRRSSITQEAKTMAMKLTGMKSSTPSAKEEHSVYGGKDASQVDYFNFMERSYSTSVLTALAGGPAPRPATRGTIRQGDSSNSTSARDVKKQQQGAPAKQEPPPMSRQTSSKEPSIASSATGSQAKKGRSLKDAARAALHIGTPTNNSKPTVSVPPYLAFRQRMQSQPSNSGEKKASPTHAEQISAPVPVPLPAATFPPQEYAPVIRESSSGQPSSSNSVKMADLDTQAGSRASEGSSSTSSAYEDGSPLPSPNTTPDTSRPQSSKDMPLHGGDTPELKEGLAIQDDETTLRQSSESSGSSNSSTTPRLGGSTELKGVDMTNEERWSRTALPLDIDGDNDTQSFTTSFSHQDEPEEASPEKVSMGRKEATQSHTEIWDALRMAMAQPKLAKSLSDPNLRPAESQIIAQNMVLPPPEKPISIPARSKRRDQPSPIESKVEILPRDDSKRPSSSDSQHSQRSQREMTRAREEYEAHEARLQFQLREENEERARREMDAKRAEEAALKRESRRERHGGHRRHHERDHQAHDGRPGSRESPNIQEHGEARNGASLQRISTSSSLASSNSNSTRAPMKSPQNAHFQQSYLQENSGPIEQPQARSSPATSRVSTPEPSSMPPRPERAPSAPTPTTDSSNMLPVAPLGPSASRPAGPVSILKQPTRSSSDPVTASSSSSTSSSSSSRQHVLSALPKHMQQLTAGVSVRPPSTENSNSRHGHSHGHGQQPIAKMFVECCNCKFYHDMPSKLYECMAKPDAVVEDRLLGISGAITTMVKCPWCQHNMSTACCAGYAAVVYLKEKLH